MRPSVPLLLASAAANGQTLTASVAATTILHGSGKANLAGGAFDLGSTIKAVLRGSMGVGAAGAGTLTFDMRIGGTVITNFGAMSLRTSSCSTNAFLAELTATITTLSSAAGAMSSMYFLGLQALGSTTTTTSATPIMLPVTGPSTGNNNWDATANGLLDVFATWSVSTTGNTLTVNQSEIWLMN